MLIALFSQYLREVRLPVPAYSAAAGCHVAWFPFFKSFPVSGPSAHDNLRNDGKG